MAVTTELLQSQSWLEDPSQPISAALQKSAKSQWSSLLNTISHPITKSKKLWKDGIFEKFCTKFVVLYKLKVKYDAKMFSTSHVCLYRVSEPSKNESSAKCFTSLTCSTFLEGVYSTCGFGNHPFVMSWRTLISLHFHFWFHLQPLSLSHNRFCPIPNTWVVQQQLLSQYQRVYSGRLPTEG